MSMPMIFEKYTHRYIDKLPKIRHMLWSNFECTLTDIAHLRHMFISNLLPGGLLFKESCQKYDQTRY